MANSLFLAYKQEQIGDAAGPGHGAVDWELATTIKATLHDSADTTVNVNTHQDIADILAAGRVATVALTSRTVVASSNTLTIDAADATFATVTGDQAEQIIIWNDSGVESTSLLIVFFDTFTSGMPVTPNGGNIDLVFNASGIFTW
ncbi:MAG TPA: hypothetical protein V6C65_16940 [Allocoleopsis sp.]